MIRSLVVALLLLGSAGTASAECAWVLWLERGDGWAIVKAFGARTECEALWNRLDAAIRPENKGRASYICLPDTIDPCRPKGK
jgi:hypothetical protein